MTQSPIAGFCYICRRTPESESEKESWHHSGSGHDTCPQCQDRVEQKLGNPPPSSPQPQTELDQSTATYQAAYAASVAAWNTARETLAVANNTYAAMRSARQNALKR